ncbi:cytochrome P450 family protein [Ktedonosporobacter rubrisoli]|uniref:cytochrome P450 family protein n=1 Tax=Ktedonosporobacter rubrisoli TaxID=2509675 RepID=UPI001A916EFC|nr:cytochrome P450 [Ktedonosporobacter rubrisoli]
MPPMLRRLNHNMLALDGPDHGRLRTLVHKAFTPSMIERMRDQVQLLTNELLDKVEPHASMDLIADFALPLPLTMIIRILGIPAQDAPMFRRWARRFLAGGASIDRILLIPTMLSFAGYLKKLIKTRLARPGDDLITALAQAREDRDQLSEDEILAMILLLLIAGHETTVNLIGSGILALLEHPDQLARLRSEPELIKPAIEELLRFVCPLVMATERYAREDITLEGVTIPRGELVVAVIGSANRDPRYFEEPDMLDITREKNKHLAFGQGVHYCLGAPLSRMEGQIAIKTLVQRMPDLRLAIPAQQLHWRGNLVMRGLEALPVLF